MLPNQIRLPGRHPSPVLFDRVVDNGLVEEAKVGSSQNNSMNGDDLAENKQPNLRIASGERVNLPVII